VYLWHTDTQMGNSQKCNSIECHSTKTVALVLVLAKLHNYCIDTDGNSDLISTARDEWQNEVNGAVPLVATRQQDSQSASCNEVIPEQLMHVGHHFNDQAGFCNRQPVMLQLHEPNRRSSTSST
jgi:hypothetical protein